MRGGVYTVLPKLFREDFGIDKINQIAGEGEAIRFDTGQSLLDVFLWRHEMWAGIEPTMFALRATALPLGYHIKFNNARGKK